MVIKRVGVVSVGKMYGVMSASFGLIAGLLMAMWGSAFSRMAESSGGSVLPFAGFGIAAIIVLPIVYGIMGFIGGLISGALYNLFAGMVGGIEIETS